MRRRLTEFSTETPSSYPTKTINELFEAILQIKSREEAIKFFRDLLTMAEITEFANRWQVVKLLLEGQSYTEIAAKLKTSTATVTRVAHWLFDGMGGYKLIAERTMGEKAQNRKQKQLRGRGKYRFIPKNPLTY